MPYVLTKWYTWLHRYVDAVRCVAKNIFQLSPNILVLLLTFLSLWSLSPFSCLNVVTDIKHFLGWRICCLTLYMLRCSYLILLMSYIIHTYIYCQIWIPTGISRSIATLHGNSKPLLLTTSPPVLLTMHTIFVYKVTHYDLWMMIDLE